MMTSSQDVRTWSTQHMRSVKRGGLMADTASHRSRPAAPGQTWTRVFPAHADQIRHARKVVALALEGFPAADDAVLCISELATNSILHSDSKKVGGTFTVYAERHEGDYVWIEVADNGGLWEKHAHNDDHPHGLGIVGELAADWGIDGDPLTGWTVWARLDWPASNPPAGI
jgi:hypothetical protein